MAINILDSVIVFQLFVVLLEQEHAAPVAQLLAVIFTWDSELGVVEDKSQAIEIVIAASLGTNYHLSFRNRVILTHHVLSEL